MQVDLTEEEVSLLKQILSSMTLTPQGSQAGTIIPTVKVVLSIWEKLDK